MHFILKMMDFILHMMDFMLKMMDFHAKNCGFHAKHDGIHAKNGELYAKHNGSHPESGCFHANLWPFAALGVVPVAPNAATCTMQQVQCDYPGHLDLSCSTHHMIIPVCLDPSCMEHHFGET